MAKAATKRAANGTAEREADWQPDNLVERVVNTQEAHQQVVKAAKRIEDLKIAAAQARKDLAEAKERRTGFLEETFDALPLFAKDSEEHE